MKPIPRPKHKQTISDENLLALYNRYKNAGFILTMPSIGKGITDKEIKLMNKVSSLIDSGG